MWSVDTTDGKSQELAVVQLIVALGHIKELIGW
jgi:hypothetical protein